MKNEIITTAVWNKKCYHHFGICPELACMYGDDPDDIVTLKMKISNDQSIPETHEKEADYWGWLDKDKEEFSMIYPQRFLLDMCFPAGIKGSEEADSGKAYRLEILKTRKH
jgi:hypothetical protein